MLQDAPAPLADVVVTAARLPPAAGEAAFSVIRLDPDRLERATRLDEALATVPAVSLFRRTSSLAANPTTQGISLRAIAPSGAGRTLVTLDGVPLNDPFGGWVLWSQVPTESLSGLDIVRGAGAGPYGAGALTGVIALRERETTGGVLDLSGGEYGGQRLAAATTLSTGRLALTGTVQRELSDGYVPVRGPRAGAADVPLDLATLSGAIRADVALTDATALSLRASAYEEDRGAGLLGARSSATGQSYAATLSRTPSADRLGWRAQVWRRESDFANTSAAVAADRSGTTPANNQFATPAEGWGANLAVRRTAVPLGGGSLEWELGADARFTEGETRELFRYMAGAFTRDRVAGGRTSVIGAYGEGSWTAGPWLVAGGLRVDGWSNSDGRRLERDRATGLATLDETDPDRSGEVVSARLAVRRELASGLAARAAAYSGFRPATLNELHRPFRVGNDLTEANAGLVPETLQGLETGLSWQGPATTLTGTVFWNRIEDAIVNVTIGTGPGTFPRAGFVPAGGVLRQRQNAGTIDATGLELTAEHRLGERVSLDGALSWTDAEVDGGSAAAQLTGLRPAQAPEWSATAGADWRATDRLSLIGRVRYESARFEDDLNSRTLDAAITADARAEYRVRDGVVVYAAADNLFDQDVEVSETGDGIEGFGPPRTLRAGLTLSW
ncbi:TonB-dependent receptor [Brevundimonas subvibrioides]|uniref:TonB-dependent receptor n=1 Tax=Brevundimonas subvibrioides (strain ATCC 15264 / DSM 4735 / LMG 14903 / NBRC 16000 / CB 81) TaxID=633149 RepID=D9QNT8_BRESC|nr:TonB-dependent receptor [Brevundimonas subvibrioides]ADL00371.1 TonB-dependent receptor [Brevundimonas subvibrioides ATCC 15264]